MSEQRQAYSVSDLRTVTEKIFQHWNVPVEHSITIADTLISSNLRGVDTHGVARIPGYIERFRTKLVEPVPEIKITSRMPFAASVDGGNGMGPVVAQAAMHEVLKRAESFGIGVATAKHSNHFGTAAYYALQAAENGCIGICLSPASKSLAPFGSMEPLFGTNPIAAAAPAGKHSPWVMDMATSIAARGHIRLAARHGQAIPEGWALDKEGRPTTDAEAALKGVMLPFSGVKGSAIAMLIDILGGVLSGSAFGGAIRDMTQDFTAPQDVGHFFLAFQIEALMPLEEFNARMEEEIARLKALKPADGFKEVLYPGEPEARKEKQRSRDGIPLTVQVADAIRKEAEEAGLGFPSPVLASA
ncbi:lactate dehydrogenase [Terrihabitans soli]|uniref:Lactate dehydrogenase n=1 Tax=Terrihabitans soli TaxID=708113 RepID=A0A6S6QT73_9HYPH|nr:Ldh family oxidoreductase [Terrihabitans soli]BCJ89648.1 lactate dehydrogenase [Terrihabitans soli]